jgi:uncharacterized protein
VGTFNPVSLLSVDPAKSKQNAVERGLPFKLAEHFAWDSALIAEDIRKVYGEARYQALGMLNGWLHMLVFTLRQNMVHVISLRRANHRERSLHAAQTQTNVDHR